MVKTWHILTLLTVVLGGLFAGLIGTGSLAYHFGSVSFGMVVLGGLGLSKARQPEAMWYQPQSFATRCLKWVSAPQIEAVILWWFGLALLLRPDTERQIAIGWLFLLLGWLLIVRLPGPVAFTLIVSTRLCFTAVIAADATLLTWGAYAGSMLYSLVAMLLHWSLRDIAGQVVRLQEEVQRLSP